MPHGVHRPGETRRIAPDAVVFPLESVEAHRNRPQPGTNQTVQPFRRQRQAVGHHPPRVAAAGDLRTDPFQIVAHEHLAAREDDEHPGGIDVRRHLLVQHPQEILRRHVLHAGIRAAVAPAMPACEVAPQRTLPEERIETVFAHLVRIETGEEFEGQPFARPDTASGHRHRPPAVDSTDSADSAGTADTGAPLRTAALSAGAALPPSCRGTDCTGCGGRTPYMRTIRGGIFRSTESGAGASSLPHAFPSRRGESFTVEQAVEKPSRARIANFTRLFISLSEFSVLIKIPETGSLSAPAASGRLSRAICRTVPGSRPETHHADRTDTADRTAPTKITFFPQTRKKNGKKF